MSISITPKDLTSKTSMSVSPVGDAPPTVGAASQEPAKAPTSPALEAPKAEATPSPKDERLEALERKERAIRVQARRLQEEKRALDAQRAPKPPTAEELKAQFLADPTKFGLTYEDIANRYLKQPSEEQQTIDRLQAQIEELKALSTTTINKVEEGQKKAYNDALKQIERDATSLVSADTSEAYGLIKAMGRVDAVTAWIEDTYNEEGVLLSVEDAAKEVESYLEETALSLAKLDKVQKRLTPAASTAAEAAPQQQTQQLHTLTQRTNPAPTGRLTPEQRKQRAILAFQRKLTA